jgi:hypothetical protein
MSFSQVGYFYPVGQFISPFPKGKRQRQAKWPYGPALAGILTESVCPARHISPVPQRI